MNKPLFTVDWEHPWCHEPLTSATLPRWNAASQLLPELKDYLLDLLRRHQITARWYVLGWLEDVAPEWQRDIALAGHVLGEHTYAHTYENWTPEQLANPLFRPPRFHGLKHKPKSGGFWFRAMPYGWVKREVLKEGMLFLHPHDLLWPEQEPTGKLYRRMGLETARDKLERLCREVEFRRPIA